MTIDVRKSEDSSERPWKMYFDDASNIVGHGIKVILIFSNEKYFPVTTNLGFSCTNNVAKYEACVMGLQAAIEKEIKMLDVHGDSTLVIYQLRREWEARNSRVIPYQKYITQLVEQFEMVKFQHLPRKDNQIADNLATLAAMFKISKNVEVQPIFMGMRYAPAYCDHVEEEIDRRPWYYNILQYKKCEQYPEHATESDKKVIRRLVMEFYFNGKMLDKRSKDEVMLICVDVVKARRLIEKIHNGVCRAYASGHILARQIMRTGYFWLTMEADCINYA